MPQSTHLPRREAVCGILAHNILFSFLNLAQFASRVSLCMCACDKGDVRVGASHIETMNSPRMHVS